MLDGRESMGLYLTLLAVTDITEKRKKKPVILYSHLILKNVFILNCMLNNLYALKHRVISTDTVRLPNFPHVWCVVNIHK